MAPMTDEPEASSCPCGRAPPLCVCPPEPLVANRVRVLVLQHPQEQDRALGTAALLCHSLASARLRIGLSWPSLRAAWTGRDGQPEPLEPAQWAVLYLGALAETPSADAPVLRVLDRKGAALPDQSTARSEIQGIVLLDGSWAQAKALWWRNPWLLKLRRLVLNPSRPSRYGDMRREPRRGALSTLEAGALALAELDRDPTIEARLVAPFEELLRRCRASGDDGDKGERPTAPRRRWRGRSRERGRPARS
jgi:DTW domain-containing protein YfiP